MKKSKQNYFTEFFENYLKNLKNTWKRIKSITSMKSSSPYSPMILTYLSETIDNPKRILYIFKNNFCTIDGKTQEKKNNHIKIVLVTSRMKMLIRFSLHQPTKNKLHLLPPPLISTNLMVQVVFQIRLCYCL